MTDPSTLGAAGPLGETGRQAPVRRALVDALIQMPESQDLQQLWPDAPAFLAWVRDQNLDPTAVASNGDTVLMPLANANLGDLVTLVLQQGWCDPAAMNEDGMSAWLYAANTGALDALEALAPALDQAARDAQNVKGSSALHLATDKPLDVTHALIRHGVSVDLGLAVDGPLHGATALMFAAETFHVQAGRKVQALIDAGASLDLLDGDGTSALTWASARGTVETVQRLLAAGASLTDSNPTGNTILMEAMAHPDHSHGKLDVLLPLVDPNQQNHQGETVLDIVMRSGRWEDAEHLLPVMRDDLIQQALAPCLGQVPTVDAWFQAAQDREQASLREVLIVESPPVHEATSVRSPRSRL